MRQEPPFFEVDDSLVTCDQPMLQRQLAFLEDPEDHRHTFRRTETPELVEGVP